MTFKIVKPLAVALPKTPQCEAMRASPYANDRASTNFQCRHSSSFQIDGSHYCKAHARIAALDYLIKQAAK